MTRLDLGKIVQNFISTHMKAGSGIVAVRKGQHGIVVVVAKATDAEKLPATFVGVRVDCVQDLGHPVGEKAIIRDAAGKIVGMQG